jgi:hypothetical protein
VIFVIHHRLLVSKFAFLANLIFRGTEQIKFYLFGPGKIKFATKFPARGHKIKKYHTNKMKLVYKKQTSHFHFPLVASTLALWSITGCVPTATARKSPNELFIVRNLHAWEEEAPFDMNYS